jgi:CHAT domain-containing protein/tetratricopeptide (TPR) repeat protein
MTISKNELNFFIFALLTLIFFPGCATKMSLEEAKKVSISMAESPAFTPPPRRIDDILSVLDQPGQFETRITEKFKAQTDATPLDTKNTRTLKGFYRDRGEAAFELGRYIQARNDLQKALSYGIMDDSDGFIKGRLGAIESIYGNFQKAIELYKESSKYPPFISSSGARYSSLPANAILVHVYAMVGDLESAKSAKRSSEFVCRSYSTRLDSEARFWCNLHPMLMDANILEAQGSYAAAEVQYRNINSLGLGPGRVLMENYPLFLISLDMMHARNLLNQQRLMEAEVESRKILMASLAHAGKESALLGQAIILLTRILQAQGRLEEAERLSDAAIRILEAAGTSADSYIMGLARVTKGDILAAKEDYTGAMIQYDLARTGMKENKFLYERSFTQNSMMILSMLMTGRYDEALRLASQNYENSRKRFGEKHERTAEMLALRGMAQEHLNHLREAVQDLSTATDILMQSRTEEGEFAHRKKLRRTIIDDYIGLLVKIKGTSIEKELGIDTVGTSFKLAEANRSRSVQGALVASSARAAVTEPQLADLVRKEQDADRQLVVMENTVLDLLAAPAGEHDPKAVQNLQLNIENLRRARDSFLAETKKHFPRYADFVNPAPRSIPYIQGFLRPGEILLSLYTTKDQTFVWAIPPKGDARFAAAAIGRDGLIPVVAKLRKSLDPKPETLGDIPDFDVSLAYDLYTKLFSPVESALNEATDLFIIANSPLDQIPFAILPTAPFQLAGDRGELFSRYRQTPWLIRKFSITMEPSVSALVNLRTLPPGDPGRKSFLGFGDPLFNREQLALLKTEQSGGKERKTQEGGSANNITAGRVQVRGIRITPKGTLDNQKITSIQTENLNRLPDTAEEIKTVARVLNADLTKDVFLREQASKHQIKTMTLSDRKVIAFATHALVPGDVDGLDQPALALSSPSVTGDKEDGLLTMTEIMKLKMNADWIVLSACNTGAASGAGAEALSGLGQAFFYAGSRAILASMYPVETTSARKLITRLFELEVSDNRLTRSQALRKSMLNLIDSETLQEQTTGKIVASYAHPLFWAPFVLMGDPGSGS